MKNKLYKYLYIAQVGDNEPNDPTSYAEARAYLKWFEDTNYPAPLRIKKVRVYENRN